MFKTLFKPASIGSLTVPIHFVRSTTYSHVQCVLESLSAGLYEGLEAGLSVEAAGSRRVRETEDRKEGFRAFIEKRKPHFVGK